MTRRPLPCGIPALLVLFLRVFGFVDAPFDLADLLGDRDLFGTDLCTIPVGLATPGPILMIQ